MTCAADRTADAPAVDARCRCMLVEAFAAAALEPLVPVVFARGPGALEGYLRAHPDQVAAARRALADCRAEARHHVARYFDWRRIPDDPAASWSLDDLLRHLRRTAAGCGAARRSHGRCPERPLENPTAEGEWG